MEQILHTAESLGCLHVPQRPLLSGQMIVDRNIPEGKAVGVIFNLAYRAQIQEAISTKEQAIEWHQKPSADSGKCQIGSNIPAA
jgi:hypothetical protein